MRYLPILFAAILVLGASGCSCVSTVERANFVPTETRSEYISLHPDGAFSECILNGEIVAGMTMQEVAASWGMPNVYVVTRTEPSDQWIYYVKDRESLSTLIYTLAFSSDTLRGWDIDQKRSIGQGIVSYGDEIDRDISAPAMPTPKKR